MKVPSRTWITLQAIVTVVLLSVLFRSLDLAAFRGLFAQVPASFYALSLAVVLGGQVVYAWRWRLLLTAAGIAVPFTTVLRQYFIGTFVNNFLPSTVGGDVAKVYYLGRDHGYRVVTASVAMDRLLGIGLLALLASVALLASPLQSSVLTTAQVVSAGIAVLAIALLILTSMGTGGLPARVAPFGEWAVKAAERLQRLRMDMAVPLTQPRIVAQAGLVVVGYALAIAAIYVRFAALQGAPTPPFVDMLAVVTATTVLSNIPISLNGLGLREHLHVSLMAPLGVSREIAVAISLLLYVHVLVASVIGLILWLQAPALPTDVTPRVGG